MLDYKKKYKELKMKLIESTEVAYRLGFEEGLKQAKADQAEMQLQQQAQMMQQMQGQQQMGQEQDPMAAEQGYGRTGYAGTGHGRSRSAWEEELMDEGSTGELDQHINELEELVSKGQKPSVLDLRKKVTEISNLRKSQKQKATKIEEKTVTAQKKLVDNILKKWSEETKTTSANLEEILSKEGLKID